MTPEDVSYWSMIGTWFAALATTMAVIISLWLASSTRKAKLKVELQLSKYGNATLRVINTSNVMATVETLSLSTSKRHIKIIRRSDNLINNPLISKSHDEFINENTIHQNGHYKEFDISFISLKNSYYKYLPYDNEGFLMRVIKMPPAYILVKIIGNQVFHIKLPPIFFERYKNDDCIRLEEALKQATEYPELYLSYTNKTERNKEQLKRLDWYIQSKVNSLYLIE